MLEQLREQLTNACQVRADAPTLVGVSGGPDSLCLLDALHSLGYRVIAAHFNHRLRAEAAEDARFVEQFARRLGVPFLGGEGDVAQFAADHSISVEEAARMQRYGFLFDQAATSGAQAVAVAHTADDQVETVLMHLLRGAGLAGLKGMPARALPHAWSETIPLVRPLLGVWRREVSEYCQLRTLQPVIDASNLDTTFFRNRLRHEVIPYLETINPNFRQLLWRTSDVLAGDFALIERLTAEAWSFCLKDSTEGAIGLALAGLTALPLGLQRNVLRKAIAALRPGLRDAGFELVERATDFIHQPTQTRQQDLGLGLRLTVEQRIIWLAAWEADLPGADFPQAPAQKTRLEIPGRLALGNGWLLEAEPVAAVTALDEARANEDPYRAWIDLPEGEALTVRGRKPGDRFQPFGLGGRSRKVADFMINIKLPQRARENWPLVCAGVQIAWLPGFRLAHPFALSEASQRVIVVSLRKLSRR